MSAKYPVILERGVTTTPRRSRTRRMAPEERSDWDAIERVTRELAEGIQQLKQAVKELQETVF